MNSKKNREEKGKKEINKVISKVNNKRVTGMIIMSKEIK